MSNREEIILSLISGGESDTVEFKESFDEEDHFKVMEKLGLLQNGKPTRASLLLVGREPQRFYPSALIKIGRFRPNDIIADDREITGPLLNQIGETMAYFREHLQTGFSFQGRPAREVSWEFPLEAPRCFFMRDGSSNGVAGH